MIIDITTTPAALNIMACEKELIDAFDAALTSKGYVSIVLCSPGSLGKVDAATLAGADIALDLNGTIHKNRYGPA